MDLFVYSRGAIQMITPHEVPHLIISITSGPDDRARLPQNEHTLGLLRLSFVDRDAPTWPGERVFEPADARAIWGLVLPLRDQARRLLVHCDAGQCRSPAVAAAVARVLGDDDSEFFRRYRPNMRVYRTLLEVHHDEFLDQPGAPAREG